MSRIKTEAAFRDLVATALTGAKKELQAEGFVDLIALVVTGKGEVRMINLQQEMNKAEDLHQAGRHEEAVEIKKNVGFGIRELLRDLKAIGYLSVGLATVSQPKDVQIVHGEEPGQGIVCGELPRFAARRRQALVLTWEWKKPDYKSGTTVQFYRREPGKIIFEETQSHEGKPTVGLLTGLLGE